MELQEAQFTCSSCGKSRGRSQLTRVGESYACRDDASCGRFLRKQRKVQKGSRTVKGREAYKLGGR